jgi:hypothetical protein
MKITERPAVESESGYALAAIALWLRKCSRNVVRASAQFSWARFKASIAVAYVSGFSSRQENVNSPPTPNVLLSFASSETTSRCLRKSSSQMEHLTKIGLLAGEQMERWCCGWKRYLTRGARECTGLNARLLRRQSKWHHLRCCLAIRPRIASAKIHTARIVMLYSIPLTHH